MTDEEQPTVTNPQWTATTVPPQPPRTAATAIIHTPSDGLAEPVAMAATIGAAMSHRQNGTAEQ